MSLGKRKRVELIAGRKLKVKVCGMRSSENVIELLKLYPDFIGFIFYDKSSRYVKEDPTLLSLMSERWPQQIAKVGVFVNASEDLVVETVQKYNLDYVQLHGHENVFYCDYLKSKGLKLIKAFAIDQHFSFTQATAYSYYCDYLLFDAKGIMPGGNGITFDWDLLQEYKGNTPFLLSGGINKDLKTSLLKIDHPRFVGVDVNSGFEIEPGLKNIEQLKEFMEGLYLPDY